MIEIASVARGRERPVRAHAQHSLVLLLLVIGLWLMMAPAAQAGEWTQVTCTQPDGPPAPIEGWQSSSIGGDGTGSGPSDTCEQPGGALTAFNSSDGPETAYTGPLWVYTVPAGSTIAGGALTVSLRTPQGQAYVATPKDEYAQADVLVNCQYNLPCGSDGTYTATVPITHLGGTQLFMAAVCVAPMEGASTCPAGSGGGVNAEISLYAADVELQNGSTPAATGLAGSLLAPAASGTADLTFSAQDPEGPGVYRVIVDLDRTAVYSGTPDTNGGRCASIGVDPSGVSEFLYSQPCKRDVAVDVPLETTRFSNGQHQLKVTVQDAAGNTAVVYDSTISFENPNAPAGTIIGPGSIAAARGPANGANASDQAKLTARWASTTKKIRTSRYGAADRIIGRLTAPGGVGISGASIDVYETPVDQGARTLRLTGVRTGPTGGWTLSLPRDISSSALRFAFRSHLEDTLPVATRTLTLSVRAAITLRIAPHVARVDGNIYFSGRLRGGPIPPAGKQLVLEARSPGTPWLEFDVIRTDSRGRFHSSYRFRLPGPHDYHFRIVSKYEADFPFAASASNAVLVVEQ